MDNGEPFPRMCWECKPDNEDGKQFKELHICLYCDRHYIHGKFLEEFSSAEEMHEFMKEKLEHVSE